MSPEIKSYLDNAIKNLVTESDIDSLKSFVEEQSVLINILRVPRLVKIKEDR